jgi:hypothetical protein
VIPPLTPEGIAAGLQQLATLNDQVKEFAGEDRLRDAANVPILVLDTVTQLLRERGVVLPEPMPPADTTRQ